MKNYIILFLLGFFAISCGEDLKGPMMKDDTSPGGISNVMVENLPGGAKISYTLPNDNDLLYVIATYTNSRGETKQVKSSVFKNYILLEGFAETNEVPITLCAVDKSDNHSPETIVRIIPLEAPIHKVAGTIRAQSTWGGAYVSMYNELKNEYVLLSLIKDSITGNWTEYDRLYTQSTEPDCYLRGFDPKPTDFAFYIRDKWGNESDTLKVNLTPLYEEEFDKSLWKDLNLADDSNQPLYKPTYQLWTGTFADKTYFFQDTKIGITPPSWISIDMGREYIFGRFRIHHVNHSDTWIYASCTPRIFELWVSNIASTNWSDWTFLGRFESIKPSGSPIGTLTIEDRAKNLEGEDHDLPLLKEGFRYVRFVNIETWGNTNNFCALEFTFWGQKVDQ